MKIHNTNKKNILYIIILILIFLISNIQCKRRSVKNQIPPFHGVYRIDTVSENLVLTYKVDYLYLSKLNYMNNHFRIYLSDDKNFYYIELKSESRKVGLSSNTTISLYKNITGMDISKFLWKITKVDDSLYTIQNKYNNKYLFKNKYYPICGDFDYKKKNLFLFKIFKLLEEVEFKKEYADIIEKEPIDVVIKYIDLTDKNLNRTGIIQINKDKDHEELRYSVRSVLQYLPWVRKIFIIMPNEKVRYFKPIDEIKEKIVYLKDKDVLGFESANIYAFIFNLYKVDKLGVSDNFIYMDDDYFIGKNLNKSDFFYYEPKEKKVVPSLINYYFNEFNRKKVDSNYNYLFRIRDKIHPHKHLGWRIALSSTEKFLCDFYNTSRLIYTEFTHNAIPMNVNDLKEIFQVIQNYKYINETLYSIERHVLTLLTQSFYGLYILNIKKRKVHTIQYRYFVIEDINFALLNDSNYAPLFVINTAGDIEITNSQFNKGMNLVKKRFPFPTKYEIIDENTSNSMNITINTNNKNSIINQEINKTFEKVNIYNSKEKENENKSKLFIFYFKIYLEYILAIVIIAVLLYLKSSKNKELKKYKKVVDTENKNIIQTKIIIV
jgi:hypothetical protein